MKMKLTGDQWLGIGIAKLTLALLLIAALAGAGCGSLPPSRQYVDDVLQIERQVRSAELKRLDERKADATLVATEITSVRGEIAAVKTTAEDAVTRAVKNRLDIAAEKSAREQSVVQLAQRLTGAARGIADHGRRITAVEKSVGDERQARETALAAEKTTREKQVKAAQATANAATAKATALTRRVGTVETTTYDHSGRKVVQLYFPTAKLNPDGSFAACAEITPHTKQAVVDLIVPAVKDGMAVVRTSGFADNRPFVDAKGKPLANTDELNAKCALARAEAVAKFLMDDAKVSLANATVRGMGKTSRFGRHDADRSVVVEMVLAPPTPAPPATEKWGFEWSAADQASADALVAKLGAGYATVQDGTNWFVHGGDFPAKADAEAKLAEVNKTAGIDGKVVKIN